MKAVEEKEEVVEDIETAPVEYHSGQSATTGLASLLANIKLDELYGSSAIFYRGVPDSDMHPSGDYGRVDRDGARAVCTESPAERRRL